MLRAYKTELLLNDKERTALMQCAGVARFVFNWALRDRINRYQDDQSTNKFEQKRRFNALKDELCPWIRTMPYTIEAQEFDNCDLAFKNFFRRIKTGGEPGFPKFKSRKRGIGGFTLRGSIKVEKRRVKLPRLGWLRLKEAGYLPVSEVKLLSANISERAGHWFVSLQVEEADKKPLVLTNDVIGIDVGIKELATCSNGKVFHNSNSLVRNEVKLAHLQRELSRRVKWSKNWEKTKKKIARLHYKISNVRKYSLNEASRYLTAIAKPKIIVLEDLNVKGMVQNRHLSKAISDASFSELRRQLEYKSKWAGIRLIVADRFYPSSKTCSQCGSVKPLLKLSERTYVCENCGVVMDRDLNAAMNLASLAPLTI